MFQKTLLINKHVKPYPFSLRTFPKIPNKGEIIDAVKSNTRTRSIIDQPPCPLKGPI